MRRALGSFSPRMLFVWAEFGPDYARTAQFAGGGSSWRLNRGVGRDKIRPLIHPYIGGLDDGPVQDDSRRDGSRL